MDLLTITASGFRHANIALAAGAALILTGCAGGGVSPLGSSIGAALPGVGDTQSPVERAESLRFASLILEGPSRSGLVVLGAVAGDTTLWPTGQQGSLALYRDGLAATAGFRRDLLGLRYTPQGKGSEPDAQSWVPWQASTPVSYRVASQWQEANGQVLAAAGDGMLRCEPAQTRPLPLGSRPLELCRESVAWEGGGVTHSRFYRSPGDHRLWAAEVTPWPEGEAIAWEVARAWW